MSYSLRLAGLTRITTRSAAEAAVASVFGPGAVIFSTPVGPIGADAVTYWMSATKTRPEVLPYFVAMTRAVHETATSVDVVAPDGLAQTITDLGVVTGAWRVYLDQREGGRVETIDAYLSSMGLEVKWGSIMGDQPIDAAIAAANAAEPALTPEQIAAIASRVAEEYAALGV